MQSLLSTSTDEEDRSYYTRIVKSVSKKFEVKRHPDPEKGRGLFALEWIQKGEIILIEEPLISMQDSDNKTDVLVCSHCLKHTGKLEDQIHWYLLHHASDDPLELQLLEQFEAKQIHLPRFNPLDESDLVYSISGAVYCSESCKKAAFDTYEQFLNKEDPFQSEIVQIDPESLDEFDQFCEETNPSFQLLAQAICKMMSSLVTLSNSNENSDPLEDLKSVWEPYWHAWRPLWWNCLTLSHTSGDQESFHETSKDLMTRASTLLKEAIKAPKYIQLFHPEVLGSLMGMIEQNNISIEIWSPLEEYIDQLNAADDATVQELWNTYPELKETIIEAAQYSVEGSGYYPIACCANHSCCPNSRSKKDDARSKNHTLILEASEAIQPGEEITISYIDETADHEERQISLNDYGFICTCPKCEKSEKHKKCENQETCENQQECEDCEENEKCENCEKCEKCD